MSTAASSRARHVLWRLKSQVLTPERFAALVVELSSGDQAWLAREYAAHLRRARDRVLDRAARLTAAALRPEEQLAAGAMGDIMRTFDTMLTRLEGATPWP